MDDLTRYQLVFPQQAAAMRLLCAHCETAALQPDRVSVNQHGSGDHDLTIGLKDLSILQAPPYPGATPCLAIALTCRSCHRRSALILTTDPERGSMIRLGLLLSLDDPDGDVHG